MVDGTTAALTPSAVSLASTWDVSIVAGIGHLLSTEMRDKKADILLAPTGKLITIIQINSGETAY